MLRRAGFFRELPHGDPAGPSLRDEVRDLPDRAEVARYLEGGALLIGSPGLAFDVLAPQVSQPIGPSHLLTDGDWVWPADYAYYVLTYGAPIPEELLLEIRSRGYQPPKLSEEDVRDLTY